MSELGMRKVQMILSRLLQNVKLRKQVQRDQQRFDRRQELHLRVFTTLCQNAACSHKFFPLRGRLCSGRFYIFTEQM